MPTTKPPTRGSGQKPEPIADYESAGADVLTAHALDEMSNSVARLKRHLRTAFGTKSSQGQQPRTRSSGLS